jgi:hypothetical protein
MSRVAFEPTNPEFERAKTVHDLDRAVTVIDIKHTKYQYQNSDYF